MIAGAAEGVFDAPQLVRDDKNLPLILGTHYDNKERKFVSRAGAREPQAHLSNGSPVDWDDDGDLDLVVGERDGRLLLVENLGSATKPRFASEAQRIRAGRRSLWVKSGDSTPVARDFDGDGLFDLLSGSSDGAVFLWRNIGQVGAPEFAPAVTLVPDGDDPKDLTRPFKKTQPAVADLDGDGTLELLVGDHRRLGDAPSRAHGFVYVYRRSSR